MKHFNAIKKYAFAHKIISTIVVVVVLGGGWYAYGKLTSTSGQTSYILGSVATGTIVASVSESGQVATTNSINLTAQVSGNITWVGVKAGDYVHAGQALASIDDTTALQAVTDAKRTLAADQLSYQQSQAQAPINFQNDQTALATAQTDLTDDYNTTYSDLSNTYLDLPNDQSVANDTLYGYDFDTTKSQWNMNILLNLFNGTINTSAVTGAQTRAVADYNAGVAQYNQTSEDFKNLTRTSTTTDIENSLNESVTTATDVAQGLQSELNFLGAVSNLAQVYNIKLPTSFTTIQSNARSALSSANSDLDTLLNDQKTLTTAKQTIVTDQENVGLDQVGNPGGSNPISLQEAANNIQKEEEDLATEESDLSDYTIAAPYAGTISAINVQVGDSAGGTIATLVSTQQIAQLSINEVDAAKIKLGEKATLTFDALPDLTLTGTVTELNPVGTVSQGVVSYSVQITFDTQNDQVKPGMTVNADIETATAQNVLIVPQAAVKAQGSQSYVQAFNPEIPQTEVTAAGSTGIVTTQLPAMIPVTTGISDNTNIEVLSGLSAGQQIITGTRTGAAAASSAATRTAAGAGTTGGNATFRGGGAAAGGATLRGL